MPFPFFFPFLFDLINNGFLMALTDAQQLEVLTLIRQIATDTKQIADDTHNILAQLGPSQVQFGWPSLGKNAQGQELTWRDAFGVEKANVAALKSDIALIK